MMRAVVAQLVIPMTTTMTNSVVRRPAIAPVPMMSNTIGARISATSSEDTYLLGGFVTSISTFRPNFETSNKSFEDLNGGLIKPGDVIEYTIIAENTGNDTSIDTVLTDVLPLGVSYVPDSLEIVNGQGEYDAGTRTITARLGQGATAQAGGEMAPPSPSPLMPRGLRGEGYSRCTVSMKGSSMAVGTR